MVNNGALSLFNQFQTLRRSPSPAQAPAPVPVAKAPAPAPAMTASAPAPAAPAPVSKSPSPAPAPAVSSATVVSAGSLATTAESGPAPDFLQSASVNNAFNAATLSGISGETGGLQASLASFVGNSSLNGVLNNFATQVLKRPPFTPNDVNLLNTQSYPNASPMQPAAPYTFTPQSVQTQLKGVLNNRFNGNTTQVNQGLAVYNNAQVTQVIPDPRLRAGLASLQGTSGQAAIDAIKSGTYSQVSFGTPPNASAVAQVVPPTTAGGKPSIVFNQNYQFEDPRLLGVTLSHEVLHSDSQLDGNEELIATALQNNVYAQMALEDPKLARSGTELSRRDNTSLMAMLNTRTPEGKINLTQSQGNVLPGAANPLPSFGAAFLGTTSSGGTATDPTSTPGNAALTAELKAVTGKTPTSTNFSTNTVNFLNQNMNQISPLQAVRLGRILNLDMNGNRPGNLF